MSTEPHDLDDFGARLAELVSAALLAYVPSMALAAEYAESADPAHREAMDGLTRYLGLELIGFVRLYEVIEQSWGNRTDAPGAVIPLARLLGESYALFGLVGEPASALTLPMASVEMVDAAYDRGARRWLARFLPELPELTKRS